MAFTRAVPARTQTDTATSGSTVNEVKCDGHHKPARKFQAGPTSKNPGRWFYSCPLGRDDPARCKFFKWADELATSSSSGQVLGTGSPRIGLAPTTPSRLMRPTGSALATPSKAGVGTPQAVSSATRTPTHYPLPAGLVTPSRRNRDKEETHSKKAKVESEGSEGDEQGEIDWESLDADKMEREAELRATPKHSQHSQNSNSGVQARLEAASVKRKRSEEGDDDSERTPKRSGSTTNPFLTTPSSHTPGSVASPLVAYSAENPHPALGGVMAALTDVGEQLARQDRLVRAAESMKRSMRTTIKNLQDKVHALEKELEEERAKR